MYTNFDMYDVSHIHKPYLVVYKKVLERNNTLNRMLNQKQSKQNELYEQFLNLKNKH